jgi:predicted MFS family arabinose efflux permease
MNVGARGGLFRHALAGAAATASGNGLARFAYVPLFPAMVSAGWVTGGEAGALGALTLVGSLIGTLGGRRVALRTSVPKLLNVGMAIIVFSLLCCSWNGGIWWLCMWRFLAGVGGGILMALAGPSAVATAPVDRRGIVGGIVIAGVGLGIAGGALAVPLFLFGGGIAGSWLGLAILVALLWIAACRHWPAITPGKAIVSASRQGAGLIVTYALHSAGMVPPMVYLADLAVRRQHLDIRIGSLLWFVFGIAGVAGGMSAGRLVDYLGGRAVLKALLTIQVVASALCLQPLTALIVPAAGLAGFVAVGATTVVLLLVQEKAGSDATLIWARCTAAYSIVQAIVALLLASVFAATNESHATIFAIGLGFSAAALVSARSAN